MKRALLALQAGPVAILVLLIVVLAVLSDVFLTLENIGNVLKQSAVICVLALGQLLVIVTRGIDLSVGVEPLAERRRRRARVARPAVGAPLPCSPHSSPARWSASSTACCYVKGRLPHPFIATLATLTAASGLALYLSNSKTIQGAPPIVERRSAPVGSRAIPGGGEIGWFPIAALVVIAWRARC